MFCDELHKQQLEYIPLQVVLSIGSLVDIKESQFSLVSTQAALCVLSISFFFIAYTEFEPTAVDASWIIVLFMLSDILAFNELSSIEHKNLSSIVLHVPANPFTLHAAPSCFFCFTGPVSMKQLSLTIPQSSVIPVKPVTPESTHSSPVT